MIKNLPQERLQQIVDFIKDNYEASEHLIPKSVDELLMKDAQSEVVVMEDYNGIEAVSFFKLISPYLALKYRTVVRLDVRGHGLSKKIDNTVENMLRTNGVRKVTTHVYTDNYPSLFGKIKRGYLVEGLLKNHDKPGNHEYVLGKEL